MYGLLGVSDTFVVEGRVGFRGRGGDCFIGIWIFVLVLGGDVYGFVI